MTTIGIQSVIGSLPHSKIIYTYTPRPYSHSQNRLCEWLYSRTIAAKLRRGDDRIPWTCGVEMYSHSSLCFK